MAPDAGDGDRRTKNARAGPPLVLPKVEAEVIVISSDDEVDHRAAVKMKKRGPKKIGNIAFDKHCLYANDVALNPSQVKYLKRRVHDQKPRIPYYVCTIQESHVIPKKEKMYFSKPYTNKYIKKHLASDKGHSLEVYFKTKNIAQVRLIFGKGNGKGAEITTNWKDVVDKTKMKKGDIFVFWFRCNVGGLKIIVRKLV